MMVPVELPWVKVIPAETLFNALYLAIRKEVSVSGVKVYHIVAGVWITGAIVKMADLALKYIKYKNQIDKLLIQPHKNIFVYLIYNLPLFYF